MPPPAREQDVNAAAYRGAGLLARYSWYRLFPQEQALFAKYYRPGDAVLDLACGIARTTLLLHEMGCRVRGIDLSVDFIDCARRRFPYLDLSTGSYTEVDSLAEAWDHVLISFNGLDYAYPKEARLQALRECRRVLKPGGTFIFSSHNIRSLLVSPYYWNRPLWKMRNTLRGLRDCAYVFEGRTYTFHASPAYVVAQVEAEGFRLEEMIGFRLSRNRLFNQYCSPYIHYAFRKSV